MPPNPDELSIEVEIEVDPEHEWRVQMLEKAGFPPYVAFLLSVRGADWHDCVRMLEQGADPDTILAILG